jgi:putative membrane protein
MKRLSLALGVLGLLLGTLLIAWIGAGHVFNAVLSVGCDGLALLGLWQMLLFGLLGLAWHTVAGARPGAERGWVFVWGRMVRDSAANCLPFSPVGGFVLGARAVTLHGVRWPLATASTVVDVTAEVVAQLVFAVIGLCLLVSKQPDTALAVPLAVGLGLALMAMGGFVLVQQGAAPMFTRLGRRIAGHWFDDADERVATLQTELSGIYAHGWRLAAAVVLHLGGWLCTGVGDWIAFQLLGIDIELSSAIAIDALLHAALAVAFVVPGNVGVQEAAYAGLGAVFGVPPDMAIGVSLLRRARDLAIGIPVLLTWQVLEMRRLRTSAHH